MEKTPVLKNNIQIKRAGSLRKILRQNIRPNNLRRNHVKRVQSSKKSTSLWQNIFKK